VTEHEAVDHPLLGILTAAAAGRFPPVDGAVEVMPPDQAGTWAVVELTGHAYVLGDVDPTHLAARGADGFGRSAHPDVLRFLAGPDGWIGCHDAVLVRRAGPTGEEPLPVRTDLDHHARVRRARNHRREVTVGGDDAGLAVVGRGLVGRIEMSVELFDRSSAGAGNGRRLILASLAAMPRGEWCFAQVSPGNAASLRAFLACGFVPIAAEVLVRPEWAGGDDAELV